MQHTWLVHACEFGMTERREVRPRSQEMGNARGIVERGQRSVRDEGIVC